MQLGFAHSLIWGLKFVATTRVSLQCDPSHNVKVQFHFDNDLADGCVISKDLAELLDIPVRDDGKNLYTFVSKASFKVGLHTESQRSFELDFAKIAVDEQHPIGHRLWIPYNEQYQSFVQERATGIHISELKGLSGKYTRRRFTRNKFKASNRIFGPLRSGVLAKSDILVLTSRTNELVGLSHDQMLRLVNELVQFRATIQDRNIRDIIPVCIYILFKHALGFKLENCGITGDHVFATLAATVELAYADTFAMIGSHTELWNLLTLEQKAFLGQTAKFWTSTEIQFNEFFFKHFSCEGHVVLQNLSFALRNPDEINSPEKMRIISDLMEHYASIVGNQLISEDIPYLAEVLRKSSDLCFKATCLDMMGWEGSFMHFCKHLKVLWPFVLQNYDSALWTYKMVLSNPDEAPRLRDTIHHLAYLYPAFSDSNVEEPLHLNWLVSNLGHYKNLNRDLLYESIEFHLYLSDFMILHSETRDPFYHKVCKYVLQILEYKEDDFEDGVNLVKFLAEFGLNRLLHILLDNTDLCKQMVENLPEKDLLNLVNATTCDGRCFIVFLDNLQPPPYFIDKFRTEFEVHPGSTADAILAVYRSETKLTIKNSEVAELEWAIPPVLLETDKLDDFTITICLQYFLYKNVFISLDLGMVTHPIDEEVSVSDYEMILNFVTEKFMKLHRNTKQIRITIPAVRDLEIAALINPGLDI